MPSSGRFIRTRLPRTVHRRAAHRRVVSRRAASRRIVPAWVVPGCAAPGRVVSRRSTGRRMLAGAWVAGLAVSLVPATSVAAAPPIRTECWQPPVDAPVVDPYREPACPWCPGNRGLEYGTRAGAWVRAVAAGHISFAGRVAGTEYVVIRHANGIRATYGGVGRAVWRVGDPVAARSVIGVALGHLHFGLRDADRYLDPTPFLGRLVHRPRLVPTDGSPPRPAPPPRLRCSGAESG